MVLHLPTWFNLEMLVKIESREKRSTRRKTSWRKGENQQQTQPTYGIDPGTTRTTLVGAKCSHHRATLAHVKVVLNRFHLDGYSIGFQPQTQQLQLHTE